VRSEKVFIIAEIGVNHNGSIALAKKAILSAKKCGADAVKFQTFFTKNLVTHSAEKAEYQKKMTSASETQYKMLKSLELSRKNQIDLKTFCRKNKIQFLSSPFDEYAADFLHSIGVRTFKIPSGEITNIPFLQHVAKMKCPIILSTGMSTMKDVETALRAIRLAGSQDITLLQCVTEYPAPYDQINLNAMISMKKRFGVEVGYSDHSIGIEVPIAAVALGARIIEKHFTIDRNLPGPDQKASLEPLEFSQMVSAIRNVEKALGDGIKRPASCEMKNIIVARKSIVAAKNIEKGEIFTKENICVKRPGSGIPPINIKKIIGKKASMNFKADELIKI